MRLPIISALETPLAFHLSQTSCAVLQIPARAPAKDEFRVVRGSVVSNVNDSSTAGCLKTRPRRRRVHLEFIDVETSAGGDFDAGLMSSTTRLRKDQRGYRRLAQ